MKKTKDIASIKDILANWRPDLREPIVKTMKASGCSYDDIGKALGITRQSAQQYVKRLEKKDA